MVHLLEGGLRVICFHTTVKKSDLVELVDRALSGPMTLVAVPTISRPAALFAVEKELRVVTEDVYAFDRLQSHLVPDYVIMTEEEVGCVERVRQCPRADWPVMLVSDPIARYLGLELGTSVLVHERSGTTNVRHVR